MRRNYRMAWTVTLTLVSGSGAPGCSLGGGGGDDDGDDGPDLTDATVHEYRVRSVAGLTTTEATVEVGLDLDAEQRNGDDSLDNLLAQAFVVGWGLDPAMVALYPIEPRCAARFAEDVAWMVTVYDGDAGAGVALTRGIDVGGMLRPSPEDAAPALGWDLAEPLTGAAAMAPLGVLSDALGSQPADFVPAIRTRIAVDSFTPDEVVLRVAVAVTPADVDRVVIPSFAAYYTAALANGPSPDVDGAFDRDEDGVVTADELRESTVVQSLLSPDLEIESVPALSLGVRITATAY
jgi:hypothetical protein